MRLRRNELVGICLALGGFTFWVLGDTCVKIAGTSQLSVWEIIAALGIFISVAMVALCAVRGQVRRVLPVRWGQVMVRSCLDLVNNVCLVIALRHMPLTMFYILVFASPMMVAILASITLKERLGVRKSVAIVAGFTGVVIAVNPFAVTRSSDWVGYVTCGLCVACFSASMVWLRNLTQTETPESLSFASGMVMVAAGGVGTIWSYSPITLHQAPALLAMGFFCTVGTICFFLALRRTAAASVSQYHYTQLVTGAIVTWVLWREVPTVWMLAGACLIILSGLYMAWLTAGSRA